MPRNKIRLFDKLLLFFNILTVTCMIFGLYAGDIDPRSFWLPALFGLGFPYLVMVNLIFAMYWLLKFRKQFFISFFGIIFCWSGLKLMIPMEGSEIKPGSTQLNVTSYNVRVFDLYNWSKNKNNRNHMLDLIEETKSDVICFQEYFFSKKPGNFNTTDTLLKTLPVKYHHFVSTKSSRTQNHFGIATFSKYRILNKGVVPMIDAGNNICIYSDILIAKDTIRIYNAHLGSMHMGKEEYNFIENFSSSNTEETIKGSRRITGMILRAFSKRAQQAEQIRKHMNQCPYPLIICGDINDTPLSFAYNTLAKGFKDSFLQQGWGIGNTYAGKFPAFRIDYILHDTSMTCNAYKTWKKNYSDHYPITAEIHW